MAAHPSTSLNGTVILHSGLERDPLVAVDDRGYRLRLQIRVGAAPQPEEVCLHGMWAYWLSALIPGDCIYLVGVSAAAEDASSAYQFAMPDAESVQVFAEGQIARIERGDLLNPLFEPPGWLRSPDLGIRRRQNSSSNFTYQYARALCTVRDSTETYVWAIFWENAKPGAMLTRDGVATNLLVVDRSCERLPCAEWCSNTLLPQYSLQSKLLAGTGATRALALPALLPYLQVGTVVRAHRIWAARKERYVNLWYQKYSSLVAFVADAAAASGSPESSHGAGATAIILDGRQHVDPTDSEWDHAKGLLEWVRGRLEQEHISNYLSLLSDVAAGPEAQFRDLVVEVRAVHGATRELEVADGSTPAAVRILAAEPEHAAEWLFAHVRVGQWLKLRAVYHDAGDSGHNGVEPHVNAVRLAVHAGRVTWLPAWCRDVVERRGSAPVAPRAPPAAAGARNAPAPPRAAAEARSAPAAAPPAVAARRLPAQRPAAAEVDAASACFALCDGFEPPTAPVTITAALAAAARGERCFVLHGFEVADAVGVLAREARVEAMLCLACHACGQRYPPASLPDSGDPNAPDAQRAKRRRAVLPCGHFTFRVTLEGAFELRDAHGGGTPDADAAVLTARFCDDGDGELFGATPEQLLEDQAQRRRAQAVLDDIVAGAGAPPTHVLAVARADATSDGSVVEGGGYFLTGTRLGRRARRS